MIRSFWTLSLFPIILTVVAFSAIGASSDTNSNPNTVIAEVNGTKITMGEFEQKRADRLFSARDAFYHQERTVLESFLDDYILKQEAEKENLTVDQLIDRHVKSKLPKDPSEDALRVYYEGLDSKEPFEAMRGKILDHIREVRLEKAKAAYMQELRAHANLVISLPPPRADVKLDNTPILGSVTAPVVVVEYADYECPYCQQEAPTMLKLEEHYKGKVAFAFKNVPLPMHPHAEKAAEAAVCAGAQGKYWDYHDELFATKKLEVPDLKEHARKLGLDAAGFDKCLDSGEKADAVKAQLTEASDLGVQGTPSFMINGRFMSGVVDYATLSSAIDQELATAGAAQPKQTARR